MSGSVSKRQDAVNVARTPAGEALSRLVVLVFRLEGALAAVESTPLSVAQIARAWSFARQSVQRVADELERDGLIRYAENPGHKRAKLVQLTPSGVQALAQIQAAQRAWANELGGQIDA